MKKYQLYDKVEEKVLAESNDSIELQIIKEDLIKKHTVRCKITVTFNPYFCTVR